MYENTLPIPLAFIILTTINLWILIGLKGLWWIKTILISCTLMLSLLVWSALNTYLGWPTHSGLPEEYQVIWVSVHEPTTDKEGSIYIWAKYVESEKDLVPYDFLVYKTKSIEPRAFSLKYTRNLHKQSQKAIDALKNGKIVMGKAKGSDFDSKIENFSSNSEQSSEESSNSENTESGGGDTLGGDPYFFELPPSKFIEKDDN